MEACEREELVADADHLAAAPNGMDNELLDVGEEDHMQGQVSPLLSCEKPPDCVILQFLVKDCFSPPWVY